MSFLRTKVCRVVLPLLVSWVSYSGASAQVEKVPKPQQLKLEIAPSKRTYSLGEAVLVRYKLTSLMDGTVCFPPPAIEVSGSFQGNLTLVARPRKPIAEEERDRFIESVWPRHPITNSNHLTCQEHANFSFPIGLQ